MVLGTFGAYRYQQVYRTPNIKYYRYILYYNKNGTPNRKSVIPNVIICLKNRKAVEVKQLSLVEKLAQHCSVAEP